MRTAVKGLVYLLLLMLAAVFFSKFRAEYSRSDVRGRQIDVTETSREPESSGDAQAEVLTNTPATILTNAVVAGTNATAPAPAVGGGKSAVAATAPPKRTALFLSLFVACVLGLAVFVGWDISQFVANKAAHGLGADLTPVEGDADYDAAEAEWAKGNHMDAINMFRAFLNRHPNQQHAAIRIAEIYEKDIGNYIAAALELEEVLTKRLPSEKWGWTAIHLANIYSGRLNQPEKALAILHRIVETHPRTSAAKKARQRLGLPEPEVEVAETAPAEEGGEESGEDASQMPRGFRKKS
jgi:TolA-binding protein